MPVFTHKQLPAGKIVFIGDSITASGRQKDRDELGFGYVRTIRDIYISEGKGAEVRILNRGVNGDRITDLADRWMKDVMEEKPDYLSISIGINDVWRQLDQPEEKQVTPNEFREIYKTLLAETTAGTNARIILMEPTVIEEDLHSEGNSRLIPYVHIIRELAEQYDALLIPVHQVFREFIEQFSEYKLTTDGVHMTSSGNMLLAKTWLEAAGRASQ